MRLRLLFFTFIIFYLSSCYNTPNPQELQKKLDSALFIYENAQAAFCECRKKEERNCDTLNFIADFCRLKLDSLHASMNLYEIIGKKAPVFYDNLDSVNKAYIDCK